MWTTNLFRTTKLTVELREIVDNGDNSVDIWAFDYPSYYKGAEKKAFERKVIDHFYFRQIGQETVGRWLHYFRTKIREIMPLYIQRYESEALMKGIDDPFGNVDITETFVQETIGNTTTANRGRSTDTQSGSSEHRFSKTPQGAIENLDRYMSEASRDNNNNNNIVDSEASGSTDSTGKVTHTFTKKGNQGVNTYAHDMLELRETFLNIDLEIIDELEELFLGVY